MSRRAARDVYARALRGGAKTVDLAVEFIDGRDGSLLWSVGGVWHRKQKVWLPGEPSSALRVEIHPGQLEAAVWFGQWFEAYLSGDAMSLAIYSVLLLGGSRAGKTWLGLRVMVAFAIAVPNARIWAVQEADPDRVEEISLDLDELLPPEWFRKTGNTYRCINGTTIRVRSAQHPKKLKRGRCDFAFLNEGQNVKEDAHNMLRMRTSDTSGLVVTAANPPNDNPDGEWVADFAQACKAGRRVHARTFHFDPNKNPRINREQLAELEHEMSDPRTYAIEVLGHVLPPSSAVYHAFSQIENVDPTPDLHEVTEAFAIKQMLGKGVTHFVGQDYQRSPHMAAVIAKAFLNPADEDRPLLYYTGAIVVDLGDEYDLSAGMYAAGLDPRTTVIVGDASGEWQGADRIEGQTSFKIMRECGWRRIFQPDKNLKANPRIIDRMKNDNRLFHSQAETRIVRVDPDVVELLEAIKKWRKKGGQPDRRSRWAHICDGMSYLNWRLYPRTLQGGGVGYTRHKGRDRARQMRGF